MRKLILSMVACAAMALPSSAQKRYADIKPDTARVHYIHRISPEDAYIMNTAGRKNTVYVNEQVTTHIVMPENIKMVDISTDAIIGNQCEDNIVRIKPASRMYDHELAGTITIIGERHISQVNVVYVKGPAKANTIYNIDLRDAERYENPDVSMPEGSMARYAWAISTMPAHFHNVNYKKYGIRGVVNNIYSIGNYFFIDFSLYNKSKIRYDVAEIRVKLSDKAETKATNSQTIELTPVYTLNNDKSFLKGYRNVIVLDKLTFPDEKILTIEVSENQISGRVVYIPIEYNDILHADGFDEKMMNSLNATKKEDDGNDVRSSVLKRKVAAMESEIASKKETSRRLDEEANEKRRTLNGLGMQISRKENRLGQLENDIQEKEAAVRKLGNKVSSLKKKVDYVNNIMESDEE